MDKLGPPLFPENRIVNLRQYVSPMKTSQNWGNPVTA